TGTIAHYIDFHTDVTEHRQMLTRLRVAERLASVGMLAAGVAHEINNPLTFVTANVDMSAAAVRRALSEAHGASAEALRDAGDMLAQARHGADRVARIVRDMMLLSRPPGDMRREPVDVRRVVETALV